MGLLIFTGSLITYVFNSQSKNIAIASFLAFCISNFIDFFIYKIYYKSHWYIKSNTSNIFGSLTDSIIFTMIAFGSFMPMIIIGQTISKIVGGLMWTFLLKPNVSSFKTYSSKRVFNYKTDD